jgi:hypothetical protein
MGLLKTLLESEFEEDGRKTLLDDMDVETRNRQQCALLVADMQVFKAANPSAAFVDVIPRIGSHVIV